MNNQSLYLTQLELHRKSIKNSLLACEEEIKHLKVNLELAELQRNNLTDSLKIASEQIAIAQAEQEK